MTKAELMKTLERVPDAGEVEIRLVMGDGGIYVLPILHADKVEEWTEEKGIQTIGAVIHVYRPEITNQ